jgi:hypothetical protein
MNRNQLHAALTEEVRQAFRTYQGSYPAMDLASAIAKDVLGKLAEVCVAETPEVVGQLILGKSEPTILPTPAPAIVKPQPWYGFLTPGGAR